MYASLRPALRLVTQVGCGADELIDLLMRCVLEPGDKIVDCPPTFTMWVGAGRGLREAGGAAESGKGLGKRGSVEQP